MGFLDIFKKPAVNDEKKSPGLTDYTHRRFHARYVLNEPEQCTVQYSNMGMFKVANLSHHGCLAEPIGGANLDQCQLPITVDFVLMGKTLKLQVSDRQKRKTGWGLIFKHATESSIRDLGQFIEPIRCGSTAIRIPDDPSKDGVKSRFRSRYQGDGPLDIVIERDEAGSICFIMVTFRQGGAYGSAIWDAGRVLTKKTIDQRGTGARMSQTEDVDHELVWMSAVSCLGLQNSDGVECVRILSSWLSSQRSGTIAKSS